MIKTIVPLQMEGQQPLAAVVYLLVRTVCISDIATRVVVRLDFNSLVSTAIALVASPCAANAILVVTFCALALAIATTLRLCVQLGPMLLLLHVPQDQFRGV